MILALTFIGPSGSGYIQNPHLKAKLAEMLYMGTYKHPRIPYGLFGEVLNSNAFALEWTFPSVMSFYIGLASLVTRSDLHRGRAYRVTFTVLRQIQYSISFITGHDECMGQCNSSQETPPREQVLLCLQTTYTDNRTNVSRFVQFVNLLLNDVTYLLDEGLSKLIEINKLQKELEIPTPASTLDPSNPRTEREQLLGTTERSATSYISLANETVSLLNKFTAFVPAAFVYPEVVDRLARMLNFNQVVLTGDKCKNLKVKDPAKYRFNPRQLLSEIVDIYLNLRGQQGFVIACARDGRSYRKAVFKTTCGILRKYILKTEDEVEKFEKFVEQVEEAKTQDEEGEEALGDIPDHFLGTNTLFISLRQVLTF